MSQMLALPTAPVGPVKGSSLHGLAIALFVLTALSVILRFWSRAVRSNQKFDLDDWVALAAWPVVGALLLIVVNWTDNGLGHHLFEVPIPDIIKGLKLLWAAEVIYDIGITMLRVSAVLFYGRVFQHDGTLWRYWIWGSVALNIAWLIAFVTVAIVQCLPIHAFWSRLTMLPWTYTCLSTRSVQLSNGITSVVMDLWVLILPLPKLWRLQMPLTKKILIICIFICGYSVIVFTIGRLVATARADASLSNDVTWAFVTPAYWYVLEMSFACMSISGPAIFNLIKRGSQHGFFSLFNDTEYADSENKSSDRRYDPKKSLERSYGNESFARLTGKPKVNAYYEIPLSRLESGRR
ncbi:MAG: hypothetical protein Q9159_006943 [Coniocarpon cinnabarinum]